MEIPYIKNVQVLEISGLKEHAVENEEVTWRYLIFNGKKGSSVLRQQTGQFSYFTLCVHPKDNALLTPSLIWLGPVSSYSSPHIIYICIARIIVSRASNLTPRNLIPWMLLRLDSCMYLRSLQGRMISSHPPSHCIPITCVHTYHHHQRPFTQFLQLLIINDSSIHAPRKVNGSFLTHAYYFIHAWNCNRPLNHCLVTWWFYLAKWKQAVF